jgi:hypothetical protein
VYLQGLFLFPSVIASNFSQDYCVPLSSVNAVAMPPPVPTDDYYATLEVSQDATLKEITKSWRRLVLKVHPDRSGGDINATEACALVRKI